MKHLSNYRRFCEKREIDSILEGTEMLFEGTIAPTNIESDKELLANSSENEKSKIENLIKKHFKQDIDLDKAPSPQEKSSGENPEDKKNEGENPENKKDEGESKNEGAVLLSITIASLIPVAMEAVGSLSNLLKRKFGINLSEDQLKQVKYYNDAITSYKKIITKGSAKFVGIDYNWKNWTELGSKLSELTGNESVQFGKGSEFLNHGHRHLKDEHKETNKEDTSETKSETKPDVKQEVKTEQTAKTEATKKEVKESLIFESEKAKVTGTNADKKLLEGEIAKLKAIRDKLFGTSFGNWLKEKGHELHHAYTSPIRLALLGMSKLTKKDSKLRDEQFREKVANVIYSITMVSLAGMGIWQGISHLNGVSEVSGIILKGIEGGVNTAEIRKQALTALMKAN
jgi:hypothetical protein